jgi:hypothetical protein
VILGFRHDELILSPVEPEPLPRRSNAGNWESIVADPAAVRKIL